MKAVPILIVTNALALGLVVLLFVQQGDLESQLKASRTSSARQSEVPEDTVGMQARIDRLERLLAAKRGEDGLGAFELPAEGVPDDGPAPAPEMEGESASPGAMEEGDAEGGPLSAEMETFRKKVRRAIELNREEDQVNRVVGRIDDLISSNKIAPLSAKAKSHAAATVLATQRKVPDIWRRLRDSGALNNVPREERGQVIRAEYENLRVEAQKELESLMPAADAKTVVEDSLRDRGMWRGDRGGSTGGRPGRR